MADLRNFFTCGFRTLFFLFLNLGCIIFFPAASASTRPPPKRRKISPLSQINQPHSSTSPAPKTRRSLSLSIRSYLSHLFCFASTSPTQQQQELQQPHHTPNLVPTSSAQQQLRHHLVADSDDHKIIPSIGSPAKLPPGDTTIITHVKRPSSFASREDVFPCAACGEVFSKTHLLDLHQATRHAFSELSDGDSGKNIVHIIFQSGWKGQGKGIGMGGDDVVKAPVVHRILKIHHSPKTLARFEEYRESVRSRAAGRWATGCGGGGDERCVADGNERLRFYCATFMCGLEREGNLGTCGSPFCAACGIVRHGFSGKDADGVATHATGWGAHASLPEELEREFEFMNVRRAMLVCRVVAGRVATGKGGDAVSAAADHGQDSGVYDSVMVGGRGDGGGGGGGGGGDGTWTAEDVLLIFNPRAMLPCFVIVYSM